MVMSEAAPSTMAASTTWPRPERWASRRAAHIPKASSIPPPPKSPTRLSGGHGPLPGAADGPQGAGQGDVVDVVARRRRQRPVLAPPRHASVHEPGIALHARLGADAESFGHARAPSLDQAVGLLDEVEDQTHPLGVLEVDGHRSPAAVEQVPVRARARRRRASRGPVDAQDVGPGVGQEHAGVGAGPDPGQLDDPDALEGSAHRCAPCTVGGPFLRPAGVGDDGVHHLRLGGGGDLVAHVGDHESSAPGMARAVASPPSRGTRVSTSPWIDEGGRRHAPERGGAVT